MTKNFRIRGNWLSVNVSTALALLFSLFLTVAGDAAPEKSAGKKTAPSASTSKKAKSKIKLKALDCHKAAQEAFKQYQIDLKEGQGRHYYDVLDPGREAYRLDPANQTYKSALIEYLLAVGEFQIKDDGPEIAAEKFREVLKIDPGNAKALKFLQTKSQEQNATSK